MEDDQPQLRQRPPQPLGRPGGDVLVGDAVEPVPADPMLPDELRRQRIGGGCRGQGAVERGIEHRDVRDSGEHGAGGADAREIDWVVQRRQGGEIVDLLLHLVGDQRRGIEPAAAVHHPVTDDADRFMAQLGKQIPDRGTVPRSLGGIVTEPFHGAAPDCRSGLPVDQPPLDRGGARVQHQHDGHP